MLQRYRDFIWFTCLQPALMQLRQHPRWAISMLALLTLTLSAVLCVAALLYHIWFKPLPYPQPQHILMLDHHRQASAAELNDHGWPYPAIAQLQRAMLQPALASGGTLYTNPLLTFYYAEEVPLTTGYQEKINTAYVSGDWQALLGAQLIHGHSNQFLATPDVQPQGAVISFALWQSAFGGTPDILQHHLNINGVNHPIRGVVSQDYHAPELFKAGWQPDLWLPWRYNNSEYKGYWQSPDPHIRVLLRAQTAQEKLTELQGKTNELAALYAPEHLRDWQTRLTGQPLTAALRGDHPVILIVFACTLTLLLLASLNLAQLYLLQLLQSRHQLAVRSVVGANYAALRNTLTCQLLLLIAPAVMLALGVTHLTLQYSAAWLSQFIYQSEQLALNWPMVLLASLLGIAILALFMALSHRHCQSDTLMRSLRRSGKGQAAQLSQTTIRRFVASQVLLVSLAILICAQLVWDNLKQLSHPLGFETQQVYELEFNVATLDWQGWSAYAPMAKAFKQALLQEPGVVAASFARTPLKDDFQFNVTAPWRDTRYLPFHRNVDQDYFTVLAQRLVTGRTFTEQDIDEQRPVVIVNRTFAQKLGGEVLGKTLEIDGSKPQRIIAVIDDLQLPGKPVPPARFYLPNFGSATYLLVKLAPGLTLSKTQLSTLLQQQPPQFVLTQWRALDDEVAHAHQYRRITTWLLVFVNLLILTITAYGIYSLQSYAAYLQQSVVKVHLMLGAKRRQVLQARVRAFLQPALMSIAFAVISVGLSWPWLKTLMVFSPSPTLIAISLGGVMVTLVAISLVTARQYVPTRRLL
ncbi:ABC transporter permease [Pseudoalteromonas sp. OOF1S-7]|uniref:ABC transporter permease n=1 Tax=Pseudoalteromonas sp. OOF1S-7 TaxID=2917757 RepID=UPI001EF546C3|nr:ABC transporter permease [Pseudoalteromonas sp. OOF1S-7]MCG7535582.1 ABC transporter permease [Pseudoalteromonas sp. OOF1S-7]